MKRRIRFSFTTGVMFAAAIDSIPNAHHASVGWALLFAFLLVLNVLVDLSESHASSRDAA